MNLDWKICSRARLSRDARFDGKFFIAVLSTKIYCRPICPARTCNESNVRYYPSAAAAAEAGFRPCLRCRPESSPGTPAWLGTSNTVSRALRLIGESGLEDGGVEVLAEHLGVGSRHLRRLFLRHLGATPIAVAHTRRLHFAKKLIDETKLPMNQIALASGFGCVRRFNAGIRKVYHRTPTQLRRITPQTGIQPGNQYLFRLNFRPPYHWKAMLAFLAARATPGVEIVEHESYRRTISMNGHDGNFEVSLDERRDALLARIEFGDPRSLIFIVERIRAMFDLNADWAAIVQSLRSDPLLSDRVKADPGLRVPGCWNGFELATRAILGQQITVKGATAMAGRMASKFGKRISVAGGLTHLFPSPKVLADARLGDIGLTAARAETIRALARAVSDGKISFAGVVNSDALLNRLCEITGIGKWTAQYVAMRALGEPDAFPSSDLGLLRAMDLSSFHELEQRAEAWRPWRAYAAMYLWRITNRNASRGERGASVRAQEQIIKSAGPYRHVS
ncbi:MAG TPA: AlkA N-terminal domain-containing protein [Terriglobales bacterium]|jgi:AraC family transcriptional regulator of adaptative response / DNA-3-methyladenine glycosylase II|nr:AlkA N-terminal domain-containing protein [Terriglobales bacterium]